MPKVTLYDLATKEAFASMLELDSIPRKGDLINYHHLADDDQIWEEGMFERSKAFDCTLWRVNSVTFGVVRGTETTARQLTVLNLDREDFAKE